MSAATLWLSMPGWAAAQPNAPSTPAPGNSRATVELLERVQAEAPDPLLLLRLAELAVLAGACEDALGHYERFFESCTGCDAQTLGVKRFEQTVERCLVTIDRESEVRGRAQIPRSKEPVTSPADATQREVTDLLKAAREVHGPRAVRALLTLAEAGPNPSPRLLNELREMAFAILSERNASAEQVEMFLQRLKKVDHQRYEVLKAELQEAKEPVALNALRRQVMDALVAGSVGGRAPRTVTASCRPNDALEWGQITVSSSPWSEAYLNGEKLGSTPVARADALAGCVTLRLIDPEKGTSVLKNVTVRSNKVAVVQVDLRTGEDSVRYE
jgi:hypothetical protein